MNHLIAIISIPFFFVACTGEKAEKVVKIENGEKKVGYFFEGKLHGSYMKFDSLGNKILESTYNHGVIDGKHREFYSNGNLMYEIDYVKGKRNGVLRHYQREGQLWEYLYYENDSIKYAKIYLPEGEIVKYLVGARVEQRVMNDSLRIEATLTHSNLENLEAGIILYGNSKSDTIMYTKSSLNQVELIISRELFVTYNDLTIEVCEVGNRNIYARCNVPIRYSNSNDIYYEEWTGRGFVTR